MTSRMCAVSLGIVAVLLAAFPPGASAQGLPGCDCPDLREMHDRWCAARAARSEYERIKSTLEAQAVKAGERRMFSNADKNMINQVCVQEAINAASDRGVPKATGKTMENMPLELFKDDCRIEASGTDLSACQKQIVEAHENNHSRACFARIARFKDKSIAERIRLQTLLFGASNMAGITLTGDTKYMMTSAQFASEEAASYALEAQLIFARWKELQKSCAGADFEIEFTQESYVGKSFWDSMTPDANGKRIHKMYDLSQSRCPNHPRPSPSQCTIR